MKTKALVLLRQELNFETRENRIKEYSDFIEFKTAIPYRYFGQHCVESVTQSNSFEHFVRF